MGFNYDTWNGSWGTFWGISWGSNGGGPDSPADTPLDSPPDAAPTPSPQPIIGAGAGWKKHSKGKPALPGYEQGARALSDLRQAKIDRILAERKAAEASTKVDAPHERPVSMAGGVLVPPVLPPAVTLGDISPELARLKRELEATGDSLEDDRRRRILLLN
jgi:hypothetical protein